MIVWCTKKRARRISNKVKDLSMSNYTSQQSIIGFLALLDIVALACIMGNFLYTGGLESLIAGGVCWVMCIVTFDQCVSLGDMRTLLLFAGIVGYLMTTPLAFRAVNRIEHRSKQNFSHKTKWFIAGSQIVLTCVWVVLGILVVYMSVVIIAFWNARPWVD